VTNAGRVLGSCALILGLVGCKASVSADASVSGQGAADGDAELRDFDTPLSVTESGSAVLADGQNERVLLGARHDLKLDPGGGSVRCECLSVSLGGVGAPGMRWSAGPPQLDDSTQLAIALSSDGQNCKTEPTDSLGASYWGYRIANDDVIVLVESARGGRPLTSGAIIPRPIGGGQVYVGPVARTLPYGRGPDGSGLCKVGNPGTPRRNALSELELGVEAPRARPQRTGNHAGLGR
jgi:hypothetical protein